MKFIKLEDFREFGFLERAFRIAQVRNTTELFVHQWLSQEKVDDLIQSGMQVTIVPHPKRLKLVPRK